MIYDICFDISSILFLGIAMISTAKQFSQPTKKHKRFIFVGVVLIVALVIDIVSAFTIQVSTDIPVKVNMLVNAVDFMCLALFVYAYARYIEAYIEDGSLKKWIQIVNLALYLLYFAAQIINIFTGFIFYFDEAFCYTRGTFYIITYLSQIYYFAYGFVIMLRHRNCFERRQFIAAISLVPFAFLGAIFQYYLFSGYLIILFTYTLGTVVIFFNMDVPDYGKMENALREAAEANRAKGDFLANMSHEIRTPMNAIVGMCELALREEDISPAIRDYCGNIQNSGRSLLAIINDILDFSKIESGKVELIEEKFNISSTINDVINMAMSRKGDKNLEIIVDVDPDIPAGLIGDELRIRQVMINLVTNGIKYTHKGSVLITVSQTKQEYGINLSFSVRDTGIGITEENLEKLFSSFEQVDTKRNRSVEGTGLGLAISRRLVTRMGGFINVTSKYGYGSEFKFVIPLEVADPAPFITVNEPEKVCGIGFIGSEKYEDKSIVPLYAKLIGNMEKKLHIGLNLEASLDDLIEKVKSGNYTHVHIGAEEFIAKKEFFTSIADDITVIVVQDRNGAIPLPENVICLYKPFYVLSIAAICNHESVLTNFNRSSHSESFIAPKAKVLVVDDNEINLKVAEGLMKPYRMQVVTAASAMEAIDALETKDYDLVFMDHMMPEIDGIEATQMIREKDDDYYKNLPIIALTANALNGVKDAFLAAGLNDFVAKPIEVSALSRAIRTWLPDDMIEKDYAEQSEAEGAALVGNAGGAGGTGFGDAGLCGGADDAGDDLFSVKTGLSYAGEDMETYMTILGTYIEKGPDKLSRIEKLLAEENWKDYVIEVHALKSTSLSIGSKQLSEAAKELEFAGKNEEYDTIRKKNAGVMELYKKVLEIGKDKLGELDGKSKVEGFGAGAGEGNGAGDAGNDTHVAAKDISKDELLSFRTRISDAAAGYDADEIIAACDELSGASFEGVLLADKFAQVKAFAKDFECEKAGEEADRVFDELGIREEA